MGSNYNYYKNAVGEWGSKARKYKSEKAKSDNLIEQDRLEQLRDYFRGPVTDIHTDIFGTEYPQYGKTKLYFITNVGSDREDILKLLNKHYFHEVGVIEETGVFKYIELIITDESIVDKLRLLLNEKFNCDLMRDV